MCHLSENDYLYCSHNSKLTIAYYYTYTCMWIYDFKKLMTHKTLLWHAMTNIGAINSRHTKTYGVTKIHGLPSNFVTTCC
jgi:hypothetical protein